MEDKLLMQMNYKKLYNHGKYYMMKHGKRIIIIIL